MTAPEFRAALLALSSDCPICDGSGVPNHYVEHNSYQCRRAEREREAAAVEAMLDTVWPTILSRDDAPLGEQGRNDAENTKRAGLRDEARAAYLAARRRE